MSLLNDVANIPLHCNICPKRPDFSDVSHLLTHVSSKGHLSWYFRTKVQAANDIAAQKIIDDYDEWYEEWNIDALMQERMSQKESKKRTSGGRRTADTSRRGSAAASSSRSTPLAAPRAQRGRLLRHNLHMLDPQLNRQQIHDHMSRATTPQSNFSFDRGMNHPFAPTMSNFGQNGLPHSFSGSGSNSPYIKQESMSSYSDIDDDDDDSFVLEPRRRRNTAPRRHQHIHSGSLNSLPDDGSLTADDMPNDETKLKGIKWPGMDIFDSATLDMRRKRNQKKHASVLRHLQATSEVVEPLETVWDAEGQFRVERVITGSPASEDALISGESEPEPDFTEKKRPMRRRAARPALVDKDINNGRVLRNRGRSHHPPFRASRASTVFKVEEDDDDLTFAPPRRNKRSGLSIHRDDSGPDITFDNPSSMNYLTSAFRNPFQQSNARDNLYRQYQNNDVHIPRAHARQPSWGNVGHIFRPSPSGNNMAIPGLIGFGNYTNQPMNNQSGSVSAAQNSFQQQFAYAGQQSMQTNMINPIYQAQTQDPFAGLFDINPVDLTFPDNTDGGFQAHTDLAASNNTLFLSSAAIKEDDEATISAHDSVNGDEK